MTAPEPRPDTGWGVAPADRFVQMSADYGTMLWHADGSGDDAESLPVPAELIGALNELADRHDALDRANVTCPNPMYWEQNPAMPIAEFNADGRALAHALKAALPPDWTVVWVDVDGWLRYKTEPLERWQLMLPGTAAP